MCRRGAAMNQLDPTLVSVQLRLEWSDYPHAAPGALRKTLRRQPLPARFAGQPQLKKGAVLITDTHTRRACLVDAYAYRGVRAVLSALFPDAPP